MTFECSCSDIFVERWNELMKGARRASYARLVARIKRELPELYQELALNLYNPWENECKQTRTHYILVHSGIEYFIRK